MHLKPWLFLAAVVFTTAPLYGSDDPRPPAPVANLSGWRLRTQPTARVRRGEFEKPAYIWELIDQVNARDRRVYDLALKEIVRLSHLSELEDADLARALLKLSSRLHGRNDAMNARVLDGVTRLTLHDDELRQDVAQAIFKFELRASLEDFSRLVQARLKQLSSDHNFLEALLRHYEDHRGPRERAHTLATTEGFLIDHLHDLLLSELEQPLASDRDIENMTSLVFAWYLGQGQTDTALLQLFLRQLSQPLPAADMKRAILLGRLHEILLIVIAAVPVQIENFRSLLTSPTSLWTGLDGAVDLRGRLLSPMVESHRELSDFILNELSSTDSTLEHRAALWPLLESARGQMRLSRVPMHPQLRTEMLLFAPNLAARLTGEHATRAEGLNALRDKTRSASAGRGGRPLFDAEHLSKLDEAIRQSRFPRSLEALANTTTLFRTARALGRIDGALHARALQLLGFDFTGEPLAPAYRVALLEAVEYLKLTLPHIPLTLATFTDLLKLTRPNLDVRVALVGHMAAREPAYAQLLLPLLDSPRFIRPALTALTRTRALDGDARTAVDAWLRRHPELQHELADELGDLGCRAYLLR